MACSYENASDDEDIQKKEPPTAQVVRKLFRPLKDKRVETRKTRDGDCRESSKMKMIVPTSFKMVHAEFEGPYSRLLFHTIPEDKTTCDPLPSVDFSTDMECDVVIIQWVFVIACLFMIATHFPIEPIEDLSRALNIMCALSGIIIVRQSHRLRWMWWAMACVYNIWCLYARFTYWDEAALSPKMCVLVDILCFLIVSLNLMMTMLIKDTVRVPEVEWN